MKQTITLFILVYFITGCSKNPGDDVLIRVQNNSSYRFEGITVYSFDDALAPTSKSYNNIKPGSSTSYKRHCQVVSIMPLYSYKIKDGVSYEQRSLRCGNGIGYLSPGKYSLLIEEDSSQYLTLRYVRN